VDTGHFTPDTDSSSKHGVSLLYHGRVDRRKGVLDFLHALSPLEGSWTATVSGIGPDLDAARALADQLELQGRVVFTGYAEYAGVNRLYQRHDVFVSPTYAEGFSNTILEAMASGHAVLSCRSVGVVDCIRDGENGLLVEPGDVGALTAAMQRLVNEKDLRERLAAAALEECRGVYSWEAVGQQIMAVYDGLRGTRQAAFDEALPVTPCRFRAEPHLL
jgi:glycosyltransferase involved in cell wall biosynthesis